MFINQYGIIYQGDCVVGDRVATPEEVSAWQSAHVTKDLLAKLDAENTLSQRNLRETILLMSEAFKQLSNGALDLSVIPGVKRVKDVESQAAVLRSQL